MLKSTNRINRSIRSLMTKKTQPPKQERLVSVSLFSGAMGLDLGFERAGFMPVFAADNMSAAIATIRANRPEIPLFEDDIRELRGEAIRAMTGLTDFDVLIGGPPCQSFSTAGSRKSVDDHHTGPLVFEFIRLVEELRPSAFLMENVKGLLSASLKWRALPYNNNGKRIDEWYGSVMRELVSRVNAIGYSVACAELNAADYGIPQRRIRVFLMGFRDKLLPTFPVPTHSETGDLFRKPWETIRPYISHLSDDTSHCARFSPRKLSYLRKIPSGGNWRDLSLQDQMASMGRAFHAKGGRSGYWRRLSWEEPAPTILTEPQNASTALCHPDLDRPLSVRECAVLQTFPENWKFAGRGAEQYRLIGNAVPVRLAEALGRHMRALLAREVQATSACREDVIMMAATG